MKMKYKKKVEDYKIKFGHLFIPYLVVIHDGIKLPVVTTYQAHYEWMREYERAEFFRKISIVELIIIIVLAFGGIYGRI